MAVGGGKYDSVLVEAMGKTNAEAALLIVLKGNLGSGFSASFRSNPGGEAEALRIVIAIVENTVAQMRADLARLDAQTHRN